VNLAFATLVGWVLAQKEATEARERRTSELLRQSEARALQNQLEPHVLYNALSSLSELIYEDPLAAEEAITQLADLYRRLTTHGKRDRVSLGEERQLVEAFLAMEQMRLGERLKVVWEWTPELDAIQLPPLLLQPLVENAIKHGIGPSEAGGEVRIYCGRDGARVYLEVANTGPAPEASAPAGVGLGNLRARLDLWQGAEASFSLGRDGTWSVARLTWNPEGGA
jgi:LytS/YehU family sensor histidine kinase